MNDNKKPGRKDKRNQRSQSFKMYEMRKNVLHPVQHLMKMGY